jgi:hypothetical protein
MPPVIQMYSGVSCLARRRGRVEEFPGKRKSGLLQNVSMTELITLSDYWLCAGFADDLY